MTPLVSVSRTHMTTRDRAVRGHERSQYCDGESCLEGRCTDSLNFSPPSVRKSVPLARFHVKRDRRLLSVVKTRLGEEKKKN